MSMYYLRVRPRIWISISISIRLVLDQDHWPLFFIEFSIILDYNQIGIVFSRRTAFHYKLISCPLNWESSPFLSSLFLLLHFVLYLMFQSFSEYREQ